MANGDTKTESYLRAAAEGTRADLPTDTCCNTKTQDLILGVANRIMDVEDEVEELKNNPDVVDIVDTYADLQAYDTQHLTENDVIRVLQDETHSGNSTYYRFTKNPDTWTFIGEISGGGSSSGIKKLTSADFNWNSTSQSATEPYDMVALWLLEPGLYDVTGLTFRTQWNVYKDASGNQGNYGLWLVTPTSYGTQVNIYGFYGNGSSGLLYANDGFTQCIVNTHPNFLGNLSLETRYLNWAQIKTTAGNSDYAVMTQNATTSMVFADPNSRYKVQIGDSASAVGSYSVAIGYKASAPQDYGVVIGNDARVTGYHGIAIGYNASAQQNSVALGRTAATTRNGEVSIGGGPYNNGYNNTKYRVLGGVYDGQDAHDAATVGQINATIDAINTALSTNIPHIGA